MARSGTTNTSLPSVLNLLLSSRHKCERTGLRERDQRKCNPVGQVVVLFGISDDKSEESPSTRRYIAYEQHPILASLVSNSRLFRFFRLHWFASLFASVISFFPPLLLLKRLHCRSTGSLCINNLTLSLIYSSRSFTKTQCCSMPRRSSCRFSSWARKLD